MKLAKLEELTEIKPFDCGDADLNGFKPLINESEDDTLPMYYDLKELLN